MIILLRISIKVKRDNIPMIVVARCIHVSNGANLHYLLFYNIIYILSIEVLPMRDRRSQQVNYFSIRADGQCNLKRLLRP